MRTRPDWNVWRAANYLSVGQIYLQDNPLLETPLTLDHVKRRLLGHWGCGGCSASSRGPAASPAMWHRKPRGRSTKAASWDSNKSGLSITFPVNTRAATC